MSRALRYSILNTDKDAKTNSNNSNISSTLGDINKDKFLNSSLLSKDTNKKEPTISGKVSDLSKDSLIKAKLQQQLQTQVIGTPINTNTLPDSQNIESENLLKSEDDDKIRLESFFDSYKVVQDFKNSGFSTDESIILMKYTYHLLEEKLNWLNQNYSPKVELENEAYLFEAAHSELIFEVTNSREISLMNLTNAMIILKRGFNNLDDETIAQIKLNDDIIKLELNLFKHENNLHQKRLNLKNTDLNSRILSDMVSVLKSEIETFRWQLTRAGIVSIMIMAISIIGVWNVTKRLAEFEAESKSTHNGPLLMPVHEQTDEESHDYEADWDERVTV